MRILHSFVVSSPLFITEYIFFPSVASSMLIDIFKERSIGTSQIQRHTNDLNTPNTPRRWSKKAYRALQLSLSVCPVVVDDRRERQNLALDCASSRTLRAMTSHLRAYCNSGMKHFAVCLIAHSSIVDGRFPAVRLEMVKNLNILNILALLRLELWLKQLAVWVIAQFTLFDSTLRTFA